MSSGTPVGKLLVCQGSQSVSRLETLNPALRGSFRLKGSPSSLGVPILTLSETVMSQDTVGTHIRHVYWVFTGSRNVLLHSGKFSGLLLGCPLATEKRTGKLRVLGFTSMPMVGGTGKARQLGTRHPGPACHYAFPRNVPQI